jgi:RNase P protein component
MMVFVWLSVVGIYEGSVFSSYFFLKKVPKKSSAVERSATKRTCRAPIATKEMAGKPCHAFIDV